MELEPLTYLKCRKLLIPIYTGLKIILEQGIKEIVLSSRSSMSKILLSRIINFNLLRRKKKEKKIKKKKKKIIGESAKEYCIRTQILRYGLPEDFLSKWQKS